MVWITSEGAAVARERAYGRGRHSLHSRDLNSNGGTLAVNTYAPQMEQGALPRGIDDRMPISRPGDALDRPDGATREAATRSGRSSCGVDIHDLDVTITVIVELLTRAVGQMAAVR